MPKAGEGIGTRLRSRPRRPLAASASGRGTAIHQDSDLDQHHQHQDQDQDQQQQQDQQQGAGGRHNPRALKDANNASSSSGAGAGKRGRGTKASASAPASSSAATATATATAATAKTKSKKRQAPAPAPAPAASTASSRSGPRGAPEQEQERTASEARSSKKPRRSTRSRSRSRSGRAAAAAAVDDADASDADADAEAALRRGAEEAPAGPGPGPGDLDFLHIPARYRLTRRDFDGGRNFTTGMAPQDRDGGGGGGGGDRTGPGGGVLRVAPYVADLFQHLYQAEARDAVTPYMDSQPDINSKMRAILIDWLVEVHMKFRLVPETLYLCVNLIDRYCIMADIRRSELQLVGVTALLIACKYEEIYPPEVRDCVYITDRAYNRQQVLDMEQDILDRLEFRITVPTAHPFLGRYLDLAGASDVARHTASFYMERTLQEHDLLHHRPSMVALAAVLLAMNNPTVLELEGGGGGGEVEDGGDGANPGGRAPGMSPLLLEYTGFEADGVREVAALICSKVEEEPVTASRRQLVAVKRKFDADKYLRVSSVCAMPRVSHLD